MDAPFPANMMDEIRAFFRDVHPRLKPGQNSYPEVFDTESFFPLQRRLELETMIKLARSIKPLTVMEIGTDKGGGLYHWCMCLPSVQNIIACEIRGTPYRYEFKKAFPNIRFLWLEQSSRDGDSVSKIKHYFPPIDILFIDGDKTKFEEDAFLYIPHMSSGGMILMHDINDTDKDYYPNPRSAYNAVSSMLWYSSLQIVNTSESVEAVRCENQGIPPRNAYEGWLRHWKGRSCGVGVIRIARKGNGSIGVRSVESVM